MIDIIELINEEIDKYYSDWTMDDEPSLADKMYQKKYGIETKQAPVEINSELVGYVNKQATRPITPVGIYKNPRNLKGFGDDTRGILLNNGDLYLAQNYQPRHANILDLLSDKGIIPFASKFDYDKKYPPNFVAVVRAGNENTFGQSSAYDVFPNEYIEIFQNADLHQPFQFKEYEFDN